MSALSDRDLVAHIRAELRHDPDAAAFAFRTVDRSWAPSEVVVDGERFRVVRALSELALREALVTRAAGERIAILTSLEDRDVGLDVLARLARRRLLRLDPWETVRGAFKAQTVEPRLRALAGLGRALLKAAPSGGYRPVPTGTLDSETAWRAYEQHVLELDSSDSLADLFVWLLRSPLRGQRWLDQPQELVDGVVRRWEQRGLRPSAWMRAIDHATGGELVDPVVVGLALGAAQRARAAGVEEASRFAIRLEEFFGQGKPPAATELVSYADAAETALDQVWEDLGDDTRSSLAMRLDALLGDKADPEVHGFARVGELGRRAAMSRLAATVVSTLDGEAERADVVNALTLVEERRDVDVDDAVVRHATDLARLASRVCAATTEFDTLPEGAERFVSEWSFEDALRERVSSWDGGVDLRDATQRVVEKWLDLSEQRNQRFAALLPDADRHAEILWAWDVIPAVVAPIAASRGVLFIVLDALNWAIARSLLAESTSWDAWAPALDAGARPVFTTIPSVTEFSRTSLLCGAPRSGNAADEAREFPKAVENAVGRACRSVLFHKGTLDSEGRGRVADDVVDAIEDDRNKVVGVVVNAIDDQLSGADQLRVSWNVADVAPLRTLLELASGTERVVVIVGDHGHVWETRSEKVSAAKSARWRDGTDAEHGEVVIGGARTKALVGVDSVVAAWSEKIRYGKGRRGYHGGASMQEVVIPLIVLDDTELDLSDRGFLRFPTAPPAWWRFEDESKLPEAVAHKAQGDLLDIVQGGWVEQLLGAPLFVDRRRRFAANDDQFVDVARTILQLVDVSRGSVNVQEVARHLGRNAAFAMRNVAALGDVMNVDGSRLLSLDRIDGMVRLDDVGVGQQFGVELAWGR